MLECKKWLTWFSFQVIITDFLYHRFFTGFGGHVPRETPSRDSGLSIEGSNNYEHLTEGLNSMGLGGRGYFGGPQSYGNQG